MLHLLQCGDCGSVHFKGLIFKMDETQSEALTQQISLGK